MRDTFYAIVFTKEFKPGEHWPLPDGRQPHPSDLKQHWRVGDLYSTGTVIGDLPSHLAAIEVAEPTEGQTWDIATKRFV